MRRQLPWVCAVVAACHEPREVEVVVAATAPPHVEPVRVVAPPPAAPQPIRRGIPSGYINAVSAVGDVVVTTDGMNAIRLWPSLDGTQEPVIVAGQGRFLVAAADGDAIAIAVVDRLGQMTIVHTTPAGAELSRDVVDLPREVRQLAVATRGFVVQLDDQRITGVDFHGHSLGTIVPASGTLVDALWWSPGHVLALSHTGRTFAGRWIELGAAIAWGATIPTVDLDLAIATLSPDGTKLAGVRKRQLVVLDTATGASVATLPSQFKAANENMYPLAWRGDRLWFRHNSATYEWDLDKAPVQRSTTLSSGVVATSHAMVAPANMGLFVITDKQRYLGYQQGKISDLVPTAGGWIGTDGSRVAHFDPSFAVDHVIDEVTGDDYGGGITLLDANHAVKQIDQTQTMLYTFDDKTGYDGLPTNGYDFQFERSTGWATLTTQDNLAFLRWLPKQGVFDSDVVFWSTEHSMLSHRLYDPAVSGGMIAQIVAPDTNYSSSDLRVITVRGIDLKKAESFRTSETHVPVPEDRIDRVLAGFDVGLDAALAPRTIVVKSADGSLIAELAGGRISMHDSVGNERWVRTARGATGLVWNADDRLVAYGDGLAEIDLETGDFVGARCGWSFGLSETQPAIFGGAEMCEQP